MFCRAATRHRRGNFVAALFDVISHQHFTLSNSPLLQWHSINFIHLFSFVNGTWHTTEEKKCKSLMSYMARCTNFESKNEYRLVNVRAKLKICLEFVSVSNFEIKLNDCTWLRLFGTASSRSFATHLSGKLIEMYSLGLCRKSQNVN